MERSIIDKSIRILLSEAYRVLVWISDCGSLKMGSVSEMGGSGRVEVDGTSTMEVIGEVGGITSDESGLATDC